MMIREIADRRSIRKYKPDEISTEAIHKMIQSGRLAPSGKMDLCFCSLRLSL